MSSDASEPFRRSVADGLGGLGRDRLDRMVGVDGGDVTEVRALSLHQPWASLIAVGVKSIETRSWSTKYRGRLLIHAAKRHADFRVMKELVGDHADAWNAWYAAGLVSVDGATDHMPLGAVVASCVLTDCVRIGGEHWFRSANWDGDEQEHQDEAVIVACDGSYNRPRLCLDTPGRGLRDVSDQEPFGDFTPGRFAWLLDDVKPTTERCPRCWGEGMWLGTVADSGTVAEFQRPDDPWWIECSTCKASGACGPVPLRGRQGLWRPEWEGVRV